MSDPQTELPAHLRLTVEDKPDQAEIELLPHLLEAFNEQQWPGHQPWQELAVLVRDGPRIRAGLAGETYAGWLFIRYLWIEESLRHQGIGRLLMAAAERRAIERGSHSVLVDTFNFQARGFYEKLGFVVFGTLDYPPRHQRFFLQKRLTTQPSEASTPGPG